MHVVFGGRGDGALPRGRGWIRSPACEHQAPYGIPSTHLFVSRALEVEEPKKKLLPSRRTPHEEEEADETAIEDERVEAEFVKHATLALHRMLDSSLETTGDVWQQKTSSSSTTSTPKSATIRVPDAAKQTASGLVYGGGIRLFRDDTKLRASVDAPAALPGSTKRKAVIQNSDDSDDSEADRVAQAALPGDYIMQHGTDGVCN